MKKVEKKIQKFLNDRRWNDLPPVDLAKSIMIEGAELLELFQWENLSLQEVKKNKEKMEEIKKELADVMIYALDLSVSLGFDTEKIISDKLDYQDKKYPAKLMLSEDRNNKANSHYWRIKKEHRKKFDQNKVK